MVFLKGGFRMCEKSNSLKKKLIMQSFSAYFFLYHQRPLLYCPRHINEVNKNTKNVRITNFVKYH